MTSVQEYRDEVAWKMSEATLQDLVEEAATWLKWTLRYHVIATAVPAKVTSKGFPDWVFCRPPQLLVVELKVEDPTKGIIAPAQQLWLKAMARCPGVDVYIWRPRHWLSGEIMRILA